MTIPAFQEKYFPNITSMTIRNYIKNNQEGLEEKGYITVVKVIKANKITILEPEKLSQEIKNG